MRFVYVCVHGRMADNHGRTASHQQIKIIAMTINFRPQTIQCSVRASKRTCKSSFLTTNFISTPTRILSDSSDIGRRPTARPPSRFAPTPRRLRFRPIRPRRTRPRPRRAAATAPRHPRPPPPRPKPPISSSCGATRATRCAMRASRRRCSSRRSRVRPRWSRTAAVT